MVVSSEKPEDKTAEQFNNESRHAVAGEAIYHLGEMSYHMEEERYNSLVMASSRILSCISIISVALIALLRTLISFLSKFSLFIGVIYVVVFLSLLASFIIALIAQYRFRYAELNEPLYFAEYTKEHEKEFNCAYEGASYYCNCINNSFKSMKKRNDKLCKLMNASTILLLVAVGLIAINILILVVLFINFGL